MLMDDFNRGLAHAFDNIDHQHEFKPGEQMLLFSRAEDLAAYVNDSAIMDGLPPELKMMLDALGGKNMGRPSTEEAAVEYLSDAIPAMYLCPQAMFN